jgi:hypothetical protein
MSEKELLIMLIESANAYHYNKWHILCKIFNIVAQIPKKYEEIKQVKTKRLYAWFITPDTFEGNEKTAILEILCEFLRLVTGQLEDLSVGL